MNCPRCSSERTVKFPITKTVEAWVCKKCAYLWENYLGGQEHERADNGRGKGEEKNAEGMG